MKSFHQGGKPVIHTKYKTPHLGLELPMSCSVTSHPHQWSMACCFAQRRSTWTWVVFTFLELLTTWLVVKLGVKWTYASMHSSIYLCIHWCISTMDQMERTGQNRHQPPFLSAEITGVPSLVRELFVSGGFPWWSRISYSRQNKYIYK